VYLTDVMVSLHLADVTVILHLADITVGLYEFLWSGQSTFVDSGTIGRSHFTILQ
jgi:hypothetical protein